MKVLDCLLFLGAILAVTLVLSGYKESFTLMGNKYPSSLVLGEKLDDKLIENRLNSDYLLNRESFIEDMNENINKDLCNPGFDCRRVGFYCSLLR